MLRLLICLTSLVVVLSACDRGKTAHSGNKDHAEVKQEIVDLLTSQQDIASDDIAQQDDKDVDRVLAHSSAEAEVSPVDNDGNVAGKADHEGDAEVEVDMD